MPAPSYLYPQGQHQPLPQEDPATTMSALSSPSLASPTKYDPHSPDPSHPYHRQYQDHLAADFQRKRNIRILKLLARLITLGLACYGVVSQAMTLEKYLSTRGIIRNNRNPWAAGTYLWPTILLLSTSSLTVLISVATMLSYFCTGVKGANAVAARAGVPMSIAENLAHLAVWIATAVGYRLGKTGSDLWGWSCDPKANAIQNVFPEVNFSMFCNVQTGSWIVSLAQVGLVVVTVGVWIYAWRRGKNQKKVRQSMEVGGFMGQYEPVRGQDVAYGVTKA